MDNITKLINSLHKINNERYYKIIELQNKLIDKDIEILKLKKEINILINIKI
jgi:hypothetical protein